MPKFLGLGSRPAVEVVYVVTDSSSIRDKMQEVNSPAQRSVNPVGQRKLKDDELKNLIDSVLGKSQSNMSGSVFPQNDINALTKKMEELSAAISQLPTSQQSIPVIKKVEELLEEMTISVLKKVPRASERRETVVRFTL